MAKKTKKKTSKAAQAVQPAWMLAETFTFDNHSYVIGDSGRLFGDPHPGPDETSFQVDNTSQQYYRSPYYLLHKDQLQPFPKPRIDPPIMTLADVIGPNMIGAIMAAKQISFHAVGDTGAAKNHDPSTEAAVADAMAAEVKAGGAAAPSFFFHLGDVIYYFGEGQYYYDQFYEPFRVYDRPIFAVPGNHDGVVFGYGKDTPKIPTLTAFLRNFCAKTPGPSPDAGSLVRSVMTQPGVYFTLDAPFVSIIGLYSNVLEGPGVISSQGGAYPSIDDSQLAFLTSELQRLKPARQNKERAVLIAVHHPPLSADSKHGGTTGLSQDIDKACQSAGLWPDAVLSGHAHLYQRYAYHAPGAGRDIPYVVSGSGGYSATQPKAGTAKAPFTIGDVTLVNGPIVDFGYLTLKVNMTKAVKTLTISFKSPKQKKALDSVTVKL